MTTSLPATGPHRERGPALAEGEVLITSFTTKGKVYSVDPKRETCTCRRFEIRKDCVKHVALAEALVKMRSRRDLLPTEDRTATERLLAMCKRTYAATPKRETVADAYDFALEVAGYRYATPRMVEDARARHKKALAEFPRRAA